MKKKLLSIMLVSLLVITTLAGCGKKEDVKETGDQTGSKENVYGEYSPENPLELKLSHFAASETNQLHLLAAAFKEKVEKATGGAVEVTIYTGGVLGNDSESLESVIAGTLDMAVNNTPIMSNFYEAFQVLDLPYLFESYDQIYAFLDSDICKELMTDFGTATGARMLCMQAVGYRNMNLSKFVKTPADIKGLKVRVTNSPVYLDQYKAWGANPLVIAGPEVITALQQGTIDGCDNVDNITYVERYFDYAKYTTVTEHAVHFNGLTINNKMFEGLTVELQELISTAAIEAAVERSKALETDNAKFLDMIADEGGEVSYEVDKESFKTAAQSVYDTFRKDNDGAKYLDGIMALAK